MIIRFNTVSRLFLGVILLFSSWPTSDVLAAEGLTEMISVSSSGEAGNRDSNYPPSLSADGRYVAFETMAYNLVSGDRNGETDIFVRDRLSGITELISISSSGKQGSLVSRNPSISADGRFVAFDTQNNLLDDGSTNNVHDVFVRDRLNGTTEQVSLSNSGELGNGHSYLSSISADGRYIAFFSEASNLVTGDTNAIGDIFVRDRSNSTTERVSVSSAGDQGNGESYDPSISADGRFIVFSSVADNFITGKLAEGRQIYIRDRLRGVTEVVSLSNSGNFGDGGSDQSAISSDGRYITFTSSATNLVLGSDITLWEVYVRDRIEETTERVSLSNAGDPGNAPSFNPSISADGRFVAFQSDASNLLSNDVDSIMDVFIRDRQIGSTEKVSVSSSGENGNNYSVYPSISADGRFVSFSSEANNLVIGDMNYVMDIFIRDRCPDGSCSQNLSFSGRVTTSADSPIPGVTVTTLSGHKSITNAAGYYNFSNLTTAHYLIKPSKPGYSFSPEWQIVSAESSLSTGSQQFSTTMVNQSADFIGSMDGGPVDGFLDLPFDYTGQGNDTFSQITEDTDNEGRINSWFDHKFPGSLNLINSGIWTYRQIKDNVEDKRFVSGGLICFDIYCYEGHDGYDFVPKDKELNPNESIKAAGDGKVVKVDFQTGGFGNYAVVYHSQGYLSLYGHLLKTSVNVNDTVVRGVTEIGLMGTSGKSTAEHLHFGVYRDQNGNKTLEFGIDPQVDPFGWSYPNSEKDPWATHPDGKGTISQYLWIEKKETQSPITGLTGGTISGPSGSTQVALLPGILSGQGFWSLFEGIPTTISDLYQRLVGFGIRIMLLEWVYPSSTESQTMPLEIAEIPYSIAIAYQEENLRHLNISQLSIHQKDLAGNWISLSSQVDSTTKTVTATTNTLGEFSLQAPLLCLNDLSEPNDNETRARELVINGNNQPGFFDLADDQDWYAFLPLSGAEYTFQASQLSTGVTLRLQLIDSDGVTVLDEVTGSNPLTWQATRAELTYVKITPELGSLIGCDTGYQLIADGPDYIFLPLIQRQIDYQIGTLPAQ